MRPVPNVKGGAVSGVPQDAQIARHLTLVADLNVGITRAALARLTRAAASWRDTDRQSRAALRCTVKGGSGDPA